jgi:hypothetical protein
MDIDKVNGVLGKAIGEFHERELDDLMSEADAKIDYQKAGEVDWKSVEHYYAGVGHHIKRRDIKRAFKWARFLVRELDKGTSKIGKPKVGRLRF